MVQQVRGSIRRAGNCVAGNYGRFLRGLGGALLGAAIATAAAAQQLTPQYAISSAAGTGTVANSADGGVASTTPINKPVGVAVDKAGNMYFSEANTAAGSLSNRVRKVNAAGILSTVAGSTGTGSNGYTGNGGPATAALLNNPYGLEIDRDGNLLIGDISNYVIRKIDFTTGIINNVAGAHAAGYTGDSGPATSAKINVGYTAAGDSHGNIYIADANNNVIRKVDIHGVITTFAGTGTAGHTGDGGPAQSATLNKPYSVWCDPAGNIYINELGTNASWVRLIDTAGIIHTVSGIGTAGYNGDGPAVGVELNTPHGAVTDGLGNVFIADETNDLVRKIDALGNLTTIAGQHGSAGVTGDGGVGTAAKVNLPYGMAIDTNNNLYEADAGGYKVRKLSLNTMLPATNVASASAAQKLFVSSTAAVTPATAGFTPTGEFALGDLSGCTLGSQLAANAVCTMPITFTPAAPGPRSAQLKVTDSTGNVSVIGITGTGNAPAVAFGPATIATVAGTGAAGYSGATSLASSALLNAPRGGVVDSGGNIYFADGGNNAIRRIDAASGAITTVAGTGQAGYSGDGASATAAQLNAPAKVVVDAAGDLYIADTGNSVIRYVDAVTGNISTIAGNGTAAYSGDGGAATAASLNRPQGLAIDLGGHVYIADTGNNVIRYFGKGGAISTFGGTGTAGYAGDNGNVFDAQFNAPEAVLLDGLGHVYIVDTGNSIIRMVSTTNRVTTIAGVQGSNTNTGDGAPAATATLATPSDLAMDAAGDLFVAASGLVRMIDGNGNISTIAGSSATGDYSGEGGVATSAVLASPATSIFVDIAANVYISDTAANRLLEVSLAKPRAMVFGRQAPNTTGSSQRVSVQNVGNTTLQFSALTVSGPFALLSEDPTACSATTALAPGTSCSLSVTFTPTATGPITGSITLTDNALNNTASAQTIHLSGTGFLLNTTQTSITLSPVSPVYGQTTNAVATATLSGSASATGSVTFTLNGVTLGVVALSGTSASIHLPSLLVGTYSLGASYAGDDNNSSSSGSTQVVVQPAVLTVTATSASRYALYQPNPTFAYTITGFVNSDVSTVVTGTPSITTTATQTSPVGTYPITPTIGTLAAANYTFTFVPAVLSVTTPPPPDYTLTVTPSTVEMENGASATFTFSLTSLYGYTGTVNFTCNAPTNIVCNFNPAALKGDPTKAVTSQLTVYLGSAYASSLGGTHWMLVVVPLLAAGIMLRRRRALAAIALSMAFFLGACGLSGCGSTVNNLPAKGTSQVTITAADSAGGLSHSATVTLKID